VNPLPAAGVEVRTTDLNREVAGFTMIVCWHSGLTNQLSHAAGTVNRDGGMTAPIGVGSGELLAQFMVLGMVVLGMEYRLFASYRTYLPSNL